MVTQQQLAKAKMRALAQGVRVWALESEPMSRYAVPSTSMDGTAYEVIVYNLAEGDVTCTCPASLHRGICKHIGAVLVRLDVEREMAQDSEDLERKVSDMYE
jgi:uncharacterized Zn finger protein